jgi:phosphogluconate dehydratase
LLSWDDFSDLAEVTPLLTRIYPNGTADVNHFHAAGGMGFVIRELLAAGLLHGDVQTVFGTGLEAYATEPMLDGAGGVKWVPAAETSGDEGVLRGYKNPFQPTGGLRVMHGNLGRAVIKTSAVAKERHVIEAPALVFTDQEQVHAAFKAGELNRDVIVVVRFQGPKANGMPELHRLMPPLGVLQDKGFKVALVTDGRMSGASGKVPAAIHVTPEAADGGAIGKIRDGDVIRVDGTNGELLALVDDSEWAARAQAVEDLSSYEAGVGRELFAAFRAVVSTADTGASIFAKVAA